MKKQHESQELPADELTDRQSAVLTCIAQLRLKMDFPPTIREIGRYMGISSTNGVNDHLKALERKGYITRADAKSRAITIHYMPGKVPYEEWVIQEQQERYYGRKYDCDVYSIPLVGKIAAGVPILASEHQEDTLILGSSMLRDAKGEVFALEVSGSSMIDDGIFDGDTIFVRKADTAPDGTIVAVLIDDSATVKRIFHEPDGRIRLQPANESMEPIFLSEEEGRYDKILGVVVSLYRKIA